MSQLRTYFWLRLGFVAGSMGLIAALTLWSVNDSWKRINALEQRFTRVSLESFRLAGEFQKSLLGLNNSVLHFTLHRDPSKWDEFAQASAVLNRWIDDQDSKLHTELERETLVKLNRTYDEYLAAADRLRTNGVPALDSTNTVADLDAFESVGKKLQQVGTELAEAHRLAEESFLDSTSQSLRHLRTLLFADVTMLLGLTGVLSWVLYRDLVAPLRIRLLESEAVLERQKKLATLGTLAAGIAHEIRNPLTSIKARLYILGKHLRDYPAGAADVEIIGGEIGRLEGIVQEVLQFARPSEPRFLVLRAGQPLREVHAFLAGTLEKPDVQLVLEPPPTIMVSVDAALIKQVLVNLVRNAVEAIDREGTVTLRLRSGQARLNGRIQDVAVMEVADTGCGIPAEVEKRLFDPFYSTKPAGTGLGLSIAARIVEKHGGMLRYQTAVGHGTTFGIVLPIVHNQESSSVPK